jgi:hypothetical protein
MDKLNRPSQVKLLGDYNKSSTNLHRIDPTLVVHMTITFCFAAQMVPTAINRKILSRFNCWLDFDIISNG